MDAIERELLGAEVDALRRELAEARFRHVAGLEAAPSLTDLFDAHPRAAHRKTVDALRAEGDAALADRVAALRAERAQAEAEERWRAAETAATGLGPDGPVTAHAAAAALVRERQRDRRRAFGRALAEAAALPEREAAVEARARARAEVGLAPDWERVVEGDALLSATDDAYRDVLGWLCRKEEGLAPQPRGDLDRADLLFLLALHPWEGLFPAGLVALAVTRLAEPLRLEVARVRVDDARRAAAWPGAHALEGRVRLAREPGAAAWLGAFQAMGAALAALASPPRLRDPAAPATAGALLAGLLLDPNYLRVRLEVDRKHAADVARALAVRELFRLRAAAAALRVASEVERGLSGAAWHEAHRDALTRAALAAWPRGLAARDGDAGAQLARLRGAARAEALRRELVEACDEDWWRNPRAAERVAQALARGGPAAGEEPPLALGAQPLVAKLGA